MNTPARAPVALQAQPVAVVGGGMACPTCSVKRNPGTQPSHSLPRRDGATFRDATDDCRRRASLRGAWERSRVWTRWRGSNHAAALARVWLGFVFLAAVVASMAVVVAVTRACVCFVPAPEAMLTRHCRVPRLC